MIDRSAIAKDHADAVFVRKTDATHLFDTDAFRRAGYEMARAMLQDSSGIETRRILLKPNVVIGLVRDKESGALKGGDEGIVTNPDFVAGIIDGLQELGAANIAICEGGGPKPMQPVFDERGYTRVAEEAGVDLIDLNKDEGTYTPEELNWRSVEDGVFYKEIPYVRPIGDDDTLLINVPTMKTHNLGIISLCGKALQGTIAVGYKHFCRPLDNDRDRFPEFREHLQPDIDAVIAANYARHLAEGYARWDQEGDRYETYAQRTCDAITAMPSFLHIVEGVIGRDGTAFQQGKDVLANLTVAGTNGVEIDAVTAYLMGHDPRNIGYLRVAAERGLGRIDPEEIPVYLLEDGEATRCLHLEQIGRVPLGCFFRGDASEYVFF